MDDEAAMRERLRGAYIEIHRLEHALCSANLLVTLLNPPKPPRTPPKVVLTPRQTDVLHKLADGYTVAQTAGALFVSESTVKSVVKGLYERLGAHTRAAAVRSAIRHGLIVDDGEVSS